MDYRPLAGIAALAAAFGYWRFRRRSQQEPISPEVLASTVSDSPKKFDRQAYYLEPERFPSGATMDSIKADNARIRGRVPGGYTSPYTNTAEAGRRAMGMLGSVPFGSVNPFTIGEDEYVGIKEWHAPHLPTQGPPHQWHHGISVFQKKKSPTPNV